jgi:predicted DNA-binding protein (UPF0251 family)
MPSTTRWSQCAPSSTLSGTIAASPPGSTGSPSTSCSGSCAGGAGPRGRTTPAITGVPDWPLDEAPAPDRAALQRELWTRIKQIIEAELTAHQRRILLAHVFHQQPLDLLAADLGISRDAVYKAIHDARRKLRAALLAGGVSIGDALKTFERGSP